MSINEIIISVMAVFAVLGILDRIFGNRLGLGNKFEEGLRTIGDLSVAVVGMLVLAPVIADVLSPVLVPVFAFLGADPAMFIGSILANDMGGAPLAESIALTKEAGQFGGLIVGAMMGVTVVFTIPTSLGMVEEKDRKFLATGVLAGVVTIPIGAFVGGLVARYPVTMILQNLVPVIILAVLIAIGLWKIPNAMIKGFGWFGKFVEILILIGLGAGILEALTGICIIPGIDPIEDAFGVAAAIAIVLAGAVPLMYVITKLFQKPLNILGKMFGMNEVSAAGLIASLANSIPMFSLIKEMDPRGKVVNMAFAVSAAFTFGDHLGFTAGFCPEMVFPMIVGKLTGGITAVLLALWLTGEKHK